MFKLLTVVAAKTSAGLQGDADSAEAGEEPLLEGRTAASAAAFSLWITRFRL